MPTARALLVCSILLLASCSGTPAEPDATGSLEPARTADEIAALGADLYTQGQIDEARLEFERAIAINPNLTAAWLGLGRIHQDAGQVEDSERTYARAVELEPDNFEANYGHAFALHLLNRLAEAVKGYLAALRINESDFDANLNLATAYLQLGEATQAVAFAQKAVEVAPESGPARVNLGAAYAAVGRHDDAVIEYQQAAELMELTPELLLNLGDSLVRVGRLEEAVNVLDQLTAMSPSAVAYERLGASLFKLKRYDEAMTSFERSLEVDADHYPAWNGIGVSCLNRYIWSGKRDRGSLDRAVDALRRSLQIERQQPRIVELLSRYG